MPTSNGIITAPVDFSDPYICLGVGQYNGWWDAKYICSNVNLRLNGASKYKPIRHMKMEELTDIDFEDANWGYLIPDAEDSIVNYVTKALSNSGWTYKEDYPLFPNISNADFPGGWIYNAPGLDDDYFGRITDFIGYNHNVDRNLAYCYAEDINQNSTVGATGFFNYFTTSNFNRLHDTYFGVIIRRVSGGTLFFKTEPDTNVGSVSFLEDESEQIKRQGYGDYYCIPFLCGQANISSFNGDKLTNILPFPAVPAVFKYEYYTPPVYIMIDVNGYSPSSNRTSVTINVIVTALQKVNFSAQKLKYQYSYTSTVDPVDGSSDIKSFPISHFADLEKGQTTSINNVVINHDIYKYTQSYNASIYFYYPQSNGVDAMVGTIDWAYER